MEPEVKSAVEEVARAAGDAGVGVVLVGALMAEFSSDLGADFPPFRRTNDADFAVYVRDWKTYKKLHDELVQRDFKPNPKIEHRLNRGAAMVDLIPYGPQIAPDGKLTWPQSGFEMTVTGFDEVCAAAQKAAGSKDSPVPVITAPGFLLLKVIAFLDRKERHDPKHRDDARDIEYWLRHYASGTEDPRRFDLAKETGLRHEDYETAGAALLGIAVGKLASPEAAACVERFLAEAGDLYSPFIDILASAAGEAKRNDALALLEAFGKGFRHARS